MNRLDVQFLNFFQTGTFGPITLGMSKTQVESVLGKPHHWGGNSDCPKANTSRVIPDQMSYLDPPIWEYDGMEFHFGCSHNLFLIFCDHLDGLARVGRIFDLDLWVFNTSREVSKVELLQTLGKEGISYEEKQNKYTGSIVLPSGVEFVYDLDGSDEIVTVELCDRRYLV